jgi:hypothetical protein
MINEIVMLTTSIRNFSSKFLSIAIVRYFTLYNLKLIYLIPCFLRVSLLYELYAARRTNEYPRNKGLSSKKYTVHGVFFIFCYSMFKFHCNL